MYEYIAIEGNIGTGKTSFASRLANEINGKLILEQFADNPFLPLFYENPARYAFQLELSFLAERYQQLSEQLAIRDLFSPLFVSDYFFPKTLLFAQNNLTEIEYNLFTRLFNIINQQIPKPDLVVYLYSDVERLMSNIALRGRDYEKHIKPDYLKNIHNRYFEYFKTGSLKRVVIIDVTHADFVNNENDYLLLKELVLQEYQPGITRLANVFQPSASFPIVF